MNKYDSNGNQIETEWKVQIMNGDGTPTSYTFKVMALTRSQAEITALDLFAYHTDEDERNYFTESEQI